MIISAQTMTLVAPTHLHPSLHLRKPSRNPPGTLYSGKIRISSAFLLLGAQPHCIAHDIFGNDALRGTKSMYRILFNHLTSALSTHSSRQSSVTFSTLSLDYGYGEVPLLDAFGDDAMNISCVDDLLQLLHECAKNVFNALEYQKPDRFHCKLTQAWLGVDFGLCQRHIAYKVAIYALLKTVMEMGGMFDGGHPMCNILSQTVCMIREDVEDQLSKIDLKLLKWFRMEQFPLLTKYFTPLLEMWASAYAKSSMISQEEEAPGTKRSRDIAAIFLAISCCVTVSKLAIVHTACPTYTMALQGMIRELLNLSHNLAPVGVLHHLATKAGLENEFLSHFGSKALHQEMRGEIIFWMGLIVEKLVAALGSGSVIAYLQTCDIPVILKELAVLGLFAFLGRKTRLFLMHMGTKDLDEPVKDFICYLECGVLFVYPKWSSIYVYKLFMEVVGEEIGWLDLYAAVPCMRHQERKRSKQHVTHAEKEIILSTVFAVCSDMFSSFAHYSSLSQQPLDAKLLEYAHTSKNLLNNCLEDYCAVYDKLCEMGRTSQIQFPESVAHTKILSTVITSLSLKDLHQKHGDLMTKGIIHCTFEGVSEISKSDCADKIPNNLPARDKISHKSLLTKYSDCLQSTISDMWLGTRLLFIDLYITIGLVQKQIFGHRLTERERKRISRTVTDFTCLIPIAILMLLPVTAIGHVAILKAIKNYMPNLIPSPYSTERLGFIKQIKRAKKMTDQSWSNLNAFSAS